LDLQRYHEVVAALAAARIKAMPLWPPPELHRMLLVNAVSVAHLVAKTSLR
jgi:hypothetical protein